MPRRPRLSVSGVPFHVFQRGNNKKQIFFSEPDNIFFLDVLQEAKEKYGCLVYAYCLMPNHFHILMEAREDNGISLFMKFLGCKYVYYVNKNYGRTGTLWEGRFKACLIEDGPYFVSCLRYIEANPLRSGLIKSPELYKWSSYKVRALGEESRHIKVDIDNWYNSLSDEALKRQDMYRKAFVNYSYGRTCKLIEKATLNGAVLGTAGFKKWVENTLGRQIIVRMPGRPTLKETAVGR